MAKTSVKLYMTNKTIEFASESIVSLEFEQQSTSDYSRPVYDIYPAYGTLVVKDKDLSLYNMALNGEFDNYNYKVEVFVNNSKVARLYISELPVYSYVDKTLSMVLGDELTKANTKIYAGYDYPLQPKTLFDVALAVLQAFDSTITETSAVFTQSMWSATQTYADYLKTISIEYPYVPANRTFRQVFKQLLTVAQSALVTDVNTVYRFVRMDGSKNTSNDNAIGILSSQITSQFQPTIIVPNKYDSCDVDCDKVSVDYNQDKVIETHEFDNLQGIVQPYKSAQNTKEEAADSAGTMHGTSVYLIIKDLGITQSQSYVFEDDLYKYLNQNLKHIIDFSVKENENPRYILTIKKTIKRIEGTVSFTRLTSGIQCYKMNPNSFSENEDSQEEIVSVEFLSLSDLSGDETFAYGTDGSYPYVSVNVSSGYSDDKYKITDKGSYYENKPKIIYKKTAEAICAYYDFEALNGNVSDIFGSSAYKYTITYEFQKLSITYNGDYTEIVFKDDTATKLKTANVKDNTASINGGEELMQYSVKQANSRPLKIAENTLKVFQNGLNGGDIECIAWDYSYFLKTGQVIPYNSTTENLKKFLSVGDMVVPCKDVNKQPVYTRKGATVYFNVVKNAITYLNGGFRQRMILRECVTDTAKTKLETPKLSQSADDRTILLYNFDYDTELIHIYVNGQEQDVLSVKDVSIKHSSTYGGVATIYVEQIDGWKQLPKGDYSIKVQLSAQGFTDSDFSNFIMIQRGFDITYNLSHVSLLPRGTSNRYYTDIKQNETLTLQFTADKNCFFPDTITVTNATYTWDKTAGSLTLSNATGNVDITITAISTQTTPVISLYEGTTIQLDEIDERAETISVSANSDVIGSVAKLPTVPEEGAPLVTATSDTEIEVDDIDSSAQKLAVYANGVKIGEVDV